MPKTDHQGHIHLSHSNEVIAVPGAAAATGSTSPDHPAISPESNCHPSDASQIELEMRSIRTFGSTPNGSNRVAQRNRGAQLPEALYSRETLAASAKRCFSCSTVYVPRSYRN